MEKIFRYKFSEEMTDSLSQFAKKNELLDRLQYKEQWDLWLIENDSLVKSETDRLHSLEYSGNVPEKMFKSARYYFRTKRPTVTKERRPYISLDTECIHAIDTYLYRDIENPDFTPQNSFMKFWQENQSDPLFLRQGEQWEGKLPEKMEAKIKKTFKNRYFILSKV